MLLELQIALAIATFVYHRFLTPKPGDESIKAQNIQLDSIPRAAEGDPVPLYWGKVKIEAPNTVWFGDLQALALQQESGGPTLAYEYSLSMQMVLGIPGRCEEDSSVFVTKLVAMQVGGRAVSNTGNMSTGQTRLLDMPDFYGGFLRGGRLGGHLAFYGGTETQSYVTDGAGGFEDTFAESEDETLLPKYRHQAMVTLHRYVIGESPNLDPVSFIAFAPTRCTGLGGGMITEIGEDANPIAVLYDLLISPFARLGYAASDIHNESFRDAADVLDEEENGFSHVLYEPGAARSLVTEILGQVDGMMFQDPDDGKLHFRLVRDDYDVGTIPAFDESDTVDVPEWSAGTWPETYNEVRVEFIDRRRNYTNRVAVAQSDAGIVANGGKVRTTTRRFLGVKTSRNADAIAARELQAVSLPLGHVKLPLNRRAVTLRPGDVFKYSRAEWGMTNRVFRVLGFDQGELADGRIWISAVEDRFAIGEVAQELPVGEIIPFPIADYEKFAAPFEAPRWIQTQAAAHGQINNPDFQRYWWAAVRPGDNNLSFRGHATDADGNATFDTDDLTFSGWGTLETSYARTAEPYDTSVGISVENLTGPVSGGATPTALEAASVVTIQVDGKNLAIIDPQWEIGEDGWPYVGGEIIAYEGFSGTGPYLLEDVWRGLLDTVPRDHAAGVPIAFLDRFPTRWLGRNARKYGEARDLRVIPRAGLLAVVPADADVFPVEISQRNQRPLPVADLKVGPRGVAPSKAPAALTVDGVDLTWKRRDRLSETIVRGDASTETVEAGTSFEVVVSKGTQVVEAVAVDALTGSSRDDVPLGAGGHGSLSVGVRSRRTVVDPALGLTDPDGSLVNWQTPTIPITAHRWRNLLLNYDFADAVSVAWVVDDGSPSSQTSASALGGGGNYCSGDGSNGGPIDMYQEVRVDGYRPFRMTATLEWYDRLVSDGVGTDDTIQVDLIALDIGGSQVGIASLGATAPSTTLWTLRSLEIANLPADTYSLRARFRLAAVGGGDSEPDAAFTEVRLRVGQKSAQLLLNPDFEGGAGPANWTVASGGFTLETTGQLYRDATFLRGGDFATSELTQDVTIAAGYEKGATCVLEIARMNDAASDTGEVIVEIRDASTALASATTGAEALSPTNVWQRRRLVVDVPNGATTIRVRLLTTRVSSPNANTCFDDLDLRLHKDLDATATRELRFDEPTRQELPRDVAQWRRAFPEVPEPTLCLFAGDRLDGHLGSEPDITATGPDSATPTTVLTGQKFVGTRMRDGRPASVDSAWEFFAGETDRVESDSLDFGRFTTGDSFTLLVVFRTLESVTDGAAHTLVGRWNDVDETGWRLYLADDGVATSTIMDAGDGVSVAGGATIFEGGPTFAALIFDAVAERLYVVDRFGSSFVSTTGESMGDAHDKFAIGPLPGMVARVYGWNEALTTSEVISLWSHASDSSGYLDTYTSAAAIAVPVGSDDDGVLVGRFGVDQVAHCWMPALEADGGTGYGLASYDQRTNAWPSQSPTAAHWSSVSSPTISFGDVAGPEGDHQHHTRVTGTNAQARRATKTSIGPSNKMLVWFARADVPHTARIVLRNSSGTALETHDFAVTADWQMFTNVFTWDNSTVDAFFDFYGSSSGSAGTVDYAGPYHLDNSTRPPYAVGPEFAVTASSPVVERTSETFALKTNTEGEVMIEGAAASSAPDGGDLFTLHNGTNNNDLRAARITGTAAPQVDHRDGSGTNVQSTAAAQSTWDDVFQVRARWARVGLLDAATAFAGVVYGDQVGDPSNYGRSSSWTPGTTAVDVLAIGGTDALDGGIRRVVVSTREEVLPE